MPSTLLDRPGPIHDDATRRGFLIGGAALAALLAGCGSDDGSSPDAPIEGRTLVSGPVVGGKLYVVNRETDASAALQAELGLTLSPQVTALPESFPGRAEISFEQISLIETDVIMINYVSSSDRQLLESNELFQGLEAVRRGSYIDLALGVGISRGYPSLLSIPYSLERTVPLIAKALAAG